MTAYFNCGHEFDGLVDRPCKACLIGAPPSHLEQHVSRPQVSAQLPPDVKAKVDALMDAVSAWGAAVAIPDGLSVLVKGETVHDPQTGNVYLAIVAAVGLKAKQPFSSKGTMLACSKVLGEIDGQILRQITAQARAAGN